MKKTAIILVTDSGFLVPSLVVCKQLAAQKVTEIADIIVYLVDVEASIARKLAAAFPVSTGIYFEALTSRSFIPSDNIFIHQNHVPVVSLARLVLNEAIPAHYDHILYLDGDLQIVGDVLPLIRYHVPEGKIAAGLGVLWLEKDSEGGSTEWAKNYLAGLGGVDPNQYFNAGVLAFRRETWQEMAPKALKFFFENSRACERHDQSALNAVCKGQSVELRPAYNFHGPYANLYVQWAYPPAIIHFTGPNKPWKYYGLPWGARFLPSYVQLLDQYTFLQPFLARPKPISLLQQAKLYARDGREALCQPRFFAKRAAFFHHIHTGRFAF